jgi:hypothetical protein
MPEVATSLAVNTIAPAQSCHHQPATKKRRLFRAHPRGAGDLDVMACKVVTAEVHEKGYGPYFKTSYVITDWKGVVTQVARSNLESLTVSGVNVVDLMHANFGQWVKLAAGARDGGKSEDNPRHTEVFSCDSALPKPIPSRECVRNAMACLIHEDLVLRIPQLGDRLISTLPSIFRNAAVKFIKPSRWGFLSNKGQLIGAIEELCHEFKGAGAEDKFILQVHIPRLITSLHCVAVRGRQIYDPECPEIGWLPLTLASFACLGIDKIRDGYKIIGG